MNSFNQLLYGSIEYFSPKGLKKYSMGEKATLFGEKALGLGADVRVIRRPGQGRPQVCWQEKRQWWKYWGQRSRRRWQFWAQRLSPLWQPQGQNEGNDENIKKKVKEMVTILRTFQSPSINYSHDVPSGRRHTQPDCSCSWASASQFRSQLKSVRKIFVLILVLILHSSFNNVFISQLTIAQRA